MSCEMETHSYINRIISTLDNLPITFFSVDKDSKVLFCNKRQAKIIGLSSIEQLIHKNIFDVGKMLGWSDEMTQQVRQNDLAVMQDGETKISEETVLLDNEYKVFLGIKSPWIDENNQVVGIIGIGIDITAEKKIKHEQQMKAAFFKERAEHLRVLAGNLVHNLRTPLAGVRVGLDIINDSFDELLHAYQMAVSNNLVKPMKAQKLNYLKNLVIAGQQNIDSASQYIDTMLNTLYQERLDIESYNYHSIAPLIDDCLKHYPFNSDNKNIINADLEHTFEFWGNAIYFKAMFNNLLKNALYYIEQNKKGEIYIWLKQSKDINQLYFKDTAKGISPQIISRIFDSYYTTSPVGTGLGLAFCQAVMESFRGSIEVKSAEGCHATFILNFPRKVESVDKMRDLDLSKKRKQLIESG
ncbi:MAG: hypothetical protein Tsb005_14310 [Gammaproteobacteria bacterium]